MPTLALYYFPPACSMASHIALEESGLAFERKLVNPGDPQARAALLRLNPKGTVPTLVIDGVVLTENVAILSYVADQAPAEKLMPADPVQRALCLSRMAWFASSVHLAFRQTRRPDKFSADAASHESIKTLGHEGFRNALALIDTALAAQPWIAGPQHSVADGYALVFYGWGLLNGYAMQELRHFSLFKDRMLERPAVRRVLEREQSVMLG